MHCSLATAVRLQFGHVYMGHQHSSPGIESQGLQGLWLGLARIVTLSVDDRVKNVF